MIDFNRDQELTSKEAMVLHRWQRETQKFCHVSGCCCLVLSVTGIGRYGLLPVVPARSWLLLFFYCVTAFFWLLHIPHNVSIQPSNQYYVLQKQLPVTRWIYRASDLSFASRGSIPGEPTWTRGGIVQVWYFLFSLLGKEVVYYRKRLRTYPRDLVEYWSAIYYSRPKFFRVI